MQYSNVHNLPDTILRAIKKRNAMYNANADRSVTTLINPPQIDILRKVHFSEMTKDISDDFFALFGSAVHQILEWGATRETAEERLWVRVNGWTVSGQIDLQRDATGTHINDYKVCAAYSITKEETVKPEWEQQLNLYDYLLYENKGVRAQSLSVIAFVRDWQRTQAQGDPAYPQSPIVPIAIPQWTLDEQRAYLLARVEAHQSAQFSFDMGLSLPECSHSDRWAKPDKWAVTKKGNKRAKLFSEQDEAEAYAAENDVTVEHRPGDSIRCDYCGVSGWCEQYKEISRGRSAQQNALVNGEDKLGDSDGDTSSVLPREMVDQKDFLEGRLPDKVENVNPQNTEEPDVARAGEIFNPFV